MTLQFTLCIQSAAHTVDPDIDYAIGAVFLHVLRSTEDDLTLGIEQTAQPGLVPTSTATGVP